MSVMIHEVSHGYVANTLGDPTAKYAKRLNLNPLNHLDMMGSFIIPLLTYMAGGFIFGWAKPVPYNPYNLKNQKRDPAIVAIAGPLSNFAVAGLFGLMIRLSSSFLVLPLSFIQITMTIIFINIILGVFNLVPIPPLDGSKILFAFLPYKYGHIQEFLERYGFFILIIFIFFFFQLLFPIIGILFKLFTGLAL
jgi:Zn-dependent protease